MNSKTNAPISKAVVELQHWGSKETFQSSPTDSEGAFQLDGIAVGPFAFTVRYLGQQFVGTRLIDGRHEIPFVLAVELRVDLENPATTVKIRSIHETPPADSNSPTGVGVRNDWTTSPLELPLARRSATDTTRKPPSTIPEDIRGLRMLLEEGQFVPAALGYESEVLTRRALNQFVVPVAVFCSQENLRRTLESLRPEPNLFVLLDRRQTDKACFRLFLGFFSLRIEAENALRRLELVLDADPSRAIWSTKTLE